MTENQAPITEAEPEPITVTEAEAPMKPSDPIPTESASADEKEELSRLREELAALRREKADRAEEERFRRLFPDTDPASLPDAVAELRQQENGISLSAAYALYLRMEEAERTAADAASRAASEKSIGSVNGGGDPIHGEYTVEEIAKMSRGEIRRHYDDVIRSLAGSHRK